MHFAVTRLCTPHTRHLTPHTQLLAPEMAYRSAFPDLPYCNASSEGAPSTYQTRDMQRPYYQAPCVNFDEKEVVYPAEEVGAGPLHGGHPPSAHPPHTKPQPSGLPALVVTGGSVWA
jgi:hypothetical protein